MYDEKKGRHGRSAAADPEASLEATATEPHRGDSLPRQRTHGGG